MVAYLLLLRWSSQLGLLCTLFLGKIFFKIFKSLPDFLLLIALVIELFSHVSSIICKILKWLCVLVRKQLLLAWLILILLYSLRIPPQASTRILVPTPLRLELGMMLLEDIYDHSLLYISHSTIAIVSLFSNTKWDWRFTTLKRLTWVPTGWPILDTTRIWMSTGDKVALLIIKGLRDWSKLIWTVLPS